MNKNKKILIIVPIALLVVIAIFIAIKGTNKEPAATGYFFSKPNTFEEIRGITITYNHGNDIITITNSRDNQNYHAYYSGYDKNGNYIKDDNNEVIEVDREIDQSVKDYIMTTVVPKLKNKPSSDNDGWSVQIDVAGGGSYKGGLSILQPRWFKNLLQKLEVEKYGNISKR